MMNVKQQPVQSPGMNEERQEEIQQAFFKAVEEKERIANEKHVEDTLSDALKRYIRMDNIAEALDEDYLKRVGGSLVENVEIDENSREEWMRELKHITKLAKQKVTTKTYPWRKASNMKFPLLVVAMVQLSSRIIPQVFQDGKVVNFKVIGPDKDAELQKIAQRREDFLNYQLLEENKEWFHESDKLFLMLGLVGQLFKKTYWDEVEQTATATLCMPQDIIINQNARSLDTVRRVTHVLYYSNNDIVERQNAGIYLDMPLKDLMPSATDEKTVEDGNQTLSSPPMSIEEDGEIDENAIHTIYECHTWLDLDKDGYQEPYIVTVHKDSQKVLRIVARYNVSTIMLNKDKDKIIKINPIQHFTSYSMLPDPAGGFYGIGFGKLLLHTNKYINSLFNMIADSGVLSNMPCGFLSKTFRTRKGDLKFRPGQFEFVDMLVGQPLDNGIATLPVKEPSMVLFQLLGMLLQVSQGITGLSDVMQGQQPAAGTPASTVVNLINQGSKVFGAILLRIYNSMSGEFRKLDAINALHVQEEKAYIGSLSAGIIKPDDFKVKFGIFPVADPNFGIDNQVLSRLNTLMQIKGEPDIDGREVNNRLLKAIREPNIQEVQPEPDPNAPPSLSELTEKANLDKISAETEKINSETGKNHAMVEIEGIKLHLQEMEQKINATFKGMQGADMKSDTIIKLVNMLSETDPRSVSEGMELAGELEAPIEAPADIPAPTEIGAQQPAGAPDQTGDIPMGQEAPTTTPSDTGESPELQVPQTTDFTRDAIPIPQAKGEVMP